MAEGALNQKSTRAATVLCVIGLAFTALGIMVAVLNHSSYELPDVLQGKPALLLVIVGPILWYVGFKRRGGRLFD